MQKIRSHLRRGWASGRKVARPKARSDRRRVDLAVRVHGDLDAVGEADGRGSKGSHGERVVVCFRKGAGGSEEHGAAKEREVRDLRKSGSDLRKVRKSDRWRQNTFSKRERRFFFEKAFFSRKRRFIF
jgi:hypothetical protein